MAKEKGQLSIETMIIYGLIILVTMSVIAGLLYFNVFDLASYLPDKCDISGSSDLKCEEMKFLAAGDNNLQLGIRNIGSKPIESLSITVVDDSKIHFGTPETASATLATSLAPGEITSVQFTTDAKEGKLLRGTIKVTYKYVDGAIEQETSGSIRVKAN